METALLVAGPTLTLWKTWVALVHPPARVWAFPENYEVSSMFGSD